MRVARRLALWLAIPLSATMLVAAWGVTSTGRQAMATDRLPSPAAISSAVGDVPHQVDRKCQVAAVVVSDAGGGLNASGAGRRSDSASRPRISHRKVMAVRVKWFVPADGEHPFRPFGIDCEDAATRFASCGEATPRDQDENTALPPGALDRRRPCGANSSRPVLDSHPRHRGRRRTRP